MDATSLDRLPSVLRALAQDVDDGIVNPGCGSYFDRMDDGRIAPHCILGHLSCRMAGVDGPVDEDVIAESGFDPIHFKLEKGYGFDIACVNDSPSRPDRLSRISQLLRAAADHYEWDRTEEAPIAGGSEVPQSTASIRSDDRSPAEVDQGA